MCFQSVDITRIHSPKKELTALDHNGKVATRLDGSNADIHMEAVLQLNVDAVGC